MKKIVFNMSEIESSTNGRIYPPSVMESAINQVKDKIERGVCFITHGKSTIDKLSVAEIDLATIVAKVTDIEKRETQLLINYEYIKGMPLSPFLEELDKLDKVYITPIGIGSVNNNIVGDDYRLIGFDIHGIED